MSEPQAKKMKTDGSQYDALSKHTVIVADTGDFNSLKEFMPTDATTNPSLIFKAAQMEEYAPLVEDGVKYAMEKISGPDAPLEAQLELAMDKIAVNFGAEITKIVPGYVSTEVDARLSFDTEATLSRARRIIELYKEVGVDKSRILIKIASTWEGIEACKVLQAEGVTCNLTLLFSLAQAVAGAEAGATLISPFVGRIMDWYKANTGKTHYEAEEDPGVLSVREIYGYYKKFGYKTVVMGASFRNKEEILALAGCDKLTIAPALLKELKASNDPFAEKLREDLAGELYPGEKLAFTEAQFRFALNEDAMATHKLAEGIRGFAADIVKLEKTVEEKLLALRNKK